MMLRDKAVFLLGQLEALRYPLINSKNIHAHYDLIESIVAQYRFFLQANFPDFKAEELR